MSEITVVAKGRAKSGCEKSLEDALRAAVGPTHREAGCIRYAVHKSLTDPAVFAVVERWASKADLDKHLASAHIQQLFQKILPLVAEPPELLFLDLIPEGDPEKSRIG